MNSLHLLPLSRYNLPLLWVLELHPVQADPGRWEVNRKLHHTRHANGLLRYDVR